MYNIWGDFIKISVITNGNLNVLFLHWLSRDPLNSVKQSSKQFSGVASNTFEKVASKFWELTVEIPFQNSSFPKLSSFYGNLLLKCVTRFPSKQVGHIKDGCNIYANNEKRFFFFFKFMFHTCILFGKLMTQRIRKRPTV